MTVAPPVDHQVPSMPASVLAALLDAVGTPNQISPRPRWGEPTSLSPHTRVQLQLHGLIDDHGAPRPAFADIARVILDPHSVVDLRFWHATGSWSLRGVLAEDAGVAINETGDDVVISGPVTPARIGELVTQLLPGTALDLDPGVELDTHLPATDALVLAAVIEAQRGAGAGGPSWLTGAELTDLVRAEAVTLRADDLRLLTRVIGGVAAPPDATAIDRSVERLRSTGIIEHSDRGVGATPSLVAVAAFLGETAPGWRWQRSTLHEPGSSTWTDQIVLIGAGGLQLRVVGGSPGHVVLQTVRPRDLIQVMAAEMALLHRPPGLDTTHMPPPQPRPTVVAPASEPDVQVSAEPPDEPVRAAAPVVPAPPAAPPEAPPETLAAPRSRRGLRIVVALLVLALAAAAGAGAVLLLNEDDTAAPAPTTSLAPTTLPDTTTTAAPTTTSTTTTTTTTTTTIPLVLVPPVVGLAAADAEAQLTELGLTVEIVEEETDTEAPGTVLSSDPDDASELTAGDTVTLTVAVEPPPDCNDVPDDLPPSTATDIGDLNAEAQTAIAWSQAVGLIGAGDARPDDPMSRGATATVLWRYFCEPAATASAGFVDVDPAAFYAAAADWSAEAGLITGLDDVTFDPDGTITRGQFVTIAWRATGSPLPLGTAPFADVDADAFYANAIDWAFTTGLVSGVTPTTFEPDAPLDRRTSLILMYRLETVIDPIVE